jgi:ABC-2 type transport system ATP-binding protein
MNAAVETAISAHGLTRRFGALTAVDGISLAIPQGRIYGFLGPNGSGKSTTIRLLCGLLAPTAGDVSVLGFEMPGEANRLRQHIGYMTQRFSLYGDLSVRENLDFIARIYGLSRERTRHRIAVNAELYRLEKLMRQRAGTLSGGQRQRLALAAVTLHEPMLLLLDEPTSAVDPQSRREFWDSIFELADHGTTILVSTHFMDEAERCHRLAILDRGRIVAEGRPEQLARDIDALVVEVSTEDPRSCRALLAEAPWIRSVTQLGSRLRVMLPRELSDGEARIRELLVTARPTDAVRTVEANLEDVFVASTRNSRGGK